MVGTVTLPRTDFWYRRHAVRRRRILIASLCLALSLPTTVAAQSDVPAAIAPLATPPPATGLVPAPSVGPPGPPAAVMPRAAVVLTERRVRDRAAARVTPDGSARDRQPAAVKALPKPDFRIGKWELQRLRWRQLQLTNGGELPIVTVGPTDRRGIPMRPLGPGGSLTYNPTVLAQQGMKRLDSYKQTGKRVHLRQARKFLDKLDALSDGGRKRRWQPHPYPYHGFERGWVNSNSHGLVLSFVSRFYRLTGNKQRLAEGERLLAAYQQRPRNQRWFSETTRKRYLWFEHWPDGKHTHTLNAHLNAMFGLYDYWHATGSPLAEQLFLGGARTVRDKLQLFRRRGDLSRYSLGVNAGTLHYHETHIEQLRILSRMTGDPWFAKQADKFVKDGQAWKVKYRGATPIGGR